MDAKSGLFAKAAPPKYTLAPCHLERPLVAKKFRCNSIPVARIVSLLMFEAWNCVDSVYNPPCSGAKLEIPTHASDC